MLIKGARDFSQNKIKTQQFSCKKTYNKNLWICPLQWRHNGHDGVSYHQPHPCLFNLLLGRKSKKTSKLRVTGLCVGNSTGTGEFPAQMASNAENVSIWWRHHAIPVIALTDTLPATLPKITIDTSISRVVYEPRKSLLPQNRTRSTPSLLLPGR